MALDRALQVRSGPLAQPLLEDGRRRSPVAGRPLDQELVAVIAADTGHAAAAGAAVARVPR